MQKQLLLDIVEQNRFTSHFSFDRVTDANASLRLNDTTASIGFIYRHIGETMNLFGQLLGTPTDVTNTTIGKTDDGRRFDVQVSRQLIDSGYGVLKELIEKSADEDWLTLVDTPFFGKVTRIRLFAHVLYHNSHHAGQISMTLAKGR
jgi:uncharacterized damage-inducible protein DinB